MIPGPRPCTFLPALPVGSVAESDTGVHPESTSTNFPRRTYVQRSRVEPTDRFELGIAPPSVSAIFVYGRLNPTEDRHNVYLASGGIKTLNPRCAAGLVDGLCSNLRPPWLGFPYSTTDRGMLPHDLHVTHCLRNRVPFGQDGGENSATVG